MSKSTTLINYIQTELVRGRDVKLSEDTDLLSSGILNSLGILQLVAFIEERFGIEIPDEDVVFENFNNVQSLSDYLNQLEQQND